jgi:hypothetical protein
MSSDQTKQDLQRAYELIRDGKKAEAEALLMPILKADEENANAWWLLANAVREPADIREALGQVLRLRPGDAKAQKMLDDLNRRSPTDEFPLDDSSSMRIGDMMGEKPKRGGDMGDVIVTKPKGGGGTNPLLIVLAVVGVLALLACIVCVGLPLIGVSIFGGQVVEQLMTEMPEFQELALTITAMPGGAFTSGNLIQRGTIEYGETVQGNVDETDDDGWTFQGSSGDRVIIELTARDSDLDTQLSLLDSSNRQIAENDDIDFPDNTNSRIDVTLSSSGAFTIRVSAFGFDGGAYDLSLRRG